MSSHDIKLPPMPEWAVHQNVDNAVQAYAIAAVEADRQRRGEPVVLATFHAIVDECEEHIMQDTRTNQLEIYDEREDAVKAAPDHLSVVPVYVTATEVPLYTAPQPAEPVVKDPLTVPEGWQLVPIEPPEEMLVDAMEASLLGRPSPDDDSYVRSIVKAWCAASPKFGEEE